MRKTQAINIILLITFIFYSQMIICQTNPVSKPSQAQMIKGWENLTWESTETDVKQKYENQLTILETYGMYANGKYYCPFEIKNYELSSYNNFTVSFLFDEKTKKLARINVTMEDPIDVLRTFQDLKTSLSEIYGLPQIIEETPSYNIKWFYPQLNIELEHLFIKSIDKKIINSIILSYKKSTKTQQVISKTTKQLEKQIEVPIYQLFPTENIWTFIKLDTRNGKMWQVNFSISEDGFKGERDLNIRSLVLNDEEINGRFTLVPTKNIYNFLLLDQLIGKTYQVQWNDEFLYRLVKPIW